MDEQKRLLLAVVLSIVVLVGYQFYFTPEPQLDNPSQEVPSQTQEQPAAVPSTVSDYTATTAAPQPAMPAVHLRQEIVCAAKNIRCLRPGRWPCPAAVPGTRRRRVLRAITWEPAPA